MFVKDLFEKYSSEEKVLEIKKFWENYSGLKEYDAEWIDVVMSSFLTQENLFYGEDVLIIETEDIFNVYKKVVSENKNYSLSFTPWNEVFSMKIANKSIKKYSELEMLCAIIFEITFYGDEQDMNATKDELYETLANIKYENLKSIEEIREKYKNEN